MSPFTETAGTFVNCEGRVQSFNGVVKPLGETRPAWKVLRVLGNLLDLQGFDYETSEEIRNEVLGMPANAKDVQADLRPRLNNRRQLAPKAAACSRLAARWSAWRRVPIYVDRRASCAASPPLQQTADATAPLAWMSPALAEKLVVVEGDLVQGQPGQRQRSADVGIDRAPARQRGAGRRRASEHASARRHVR